MRTAFGIVRDRVRGQPAVQVEHLRDERDRPVVPRYVGGIEAEGRAALKLGGHLLIAEPRIHIGAATFERSVALARNVGLEPVAWPAFALSRATLCRT